MDFCKLSKTRNNDFLKALSIQHLFRQTTAIYTVLEFSSNTLSFCMSPNKVCVVQPCYCSRGIQDQLPLNICSHFRAVEKGGQGGLQLPAPPPSFPGTNFFFHVKSKNIKFSWNFYMRIKCETYAYLLNKT